MYLAQGYNTVTRVRIQPRPLAPGSDALPLGQGASPLSFLHSGGVESLIFKLEMCVHVFINEIDNILALFHTIFVNLY